MDSLAQAGKPSGGGPIGAINCHAWTSDSELGSVFSLAENVFDGEPKPISPLGDSGDHMLQRVSRLVRTGLKPGFESC